MKTTANTGSRIEELLNWGTDQLAQSKVYEPALEAQLLLSQVLRLKKLDLFLKKEKEISAEFMTIGDKKLLEREMREAAKNLDFERAADIRELIKNLK